MRDLDTATFAELAEVNPAVDLRALSPESVVSFIPMSDLTEGGLWVNRQERGLDAIRSGYTPFAEGDLLFAKITPCMENGKGAHAVGLTNGVGFGSTEFHVLRAKEDNSPRFLFHWLQSRSMRTRAVAYMGGSAGQQRVQPDFFTNYRVKAIAPPEQVQIAAVLDTIDDAIAKTEAVNAKLRQVRVGLLHDLLTRGLDEKGQLRDPVAHPEQFQSSAIGRIPIAWKIEPARRLCSIITKGTTPPPSAFSTSERSIRYLRVDNLSFTGELDLSASQLFIDRATHEGLLSRSKVFEGDVLMNIVGPPLGKVCLVPSADNGWNINQAIAVFRPRTDISPLFLTTWTSSFAAQAWFWREAKRTSGQVNLTLEMCENLPVPLPSPEEIARIAELLVSTDALRLAGENHLKKCRALRSGLGDDLLTGRVRVPQSIGANA
jgi:type I restriction enzyme S subunit